MCVREFVWEDGKASLTGERGIEDFPCGSLCAVGQQAVPAESGDTVIPGGIYHGHAHETKLHTIVNGGSEDVKIALTLAYSAHCRAV